MHWKQQKRWILARPFLQPIGGNGFFLVIKKYYESWKYGKDRTRRVLQGKVAAGEKQPTDCLHWAKLMSVRAVGEPVTRLVCHANTLSCHGAAGRRSWKTSPAALPGHKVVWGNDLPGLPDFSSISAPFWRQNVIPVHWQGKEHIFSSLFIHLNLQLVVRRTHHGHYGASLSTQTQFSVCLTP